MTLAKLAVAQHEAAHVVVGLALGLRLRKASARPSIDSEGYCWFPLPPNRRVLAEAIMTAAGVAWERASNPGQADEDGYACHDAIEARALVASDHDYETCVKTAGYILETRGAAHKQLARALLEQDLTGADIAALARGDALERD